MPPFSNHCANLNRSVVHVGGGVDNRGQLTDADLKTLLDLLKRIAILVRAHERDGETLGAESTGTAHSVQVGVSVAWHVEVEHDVDLLNINTAAKELSGDEDAGLELFEALVDSNSVQIQKWRDAKKLRMSQYQSSVVTYLSSRLILPWMALEGMAFLLSTSLSLTA